MRFFDIALVFFFLFVVFLPLRFGLAAEEAFLLVGRLALVEVAFASAASVAPFSFRLRPATATISPSRFRFVFFDSFCSVLESWGQHTGYGSFVDVDVDEAAGIKAQPQAAHGRDGAHRH